MTSWGDFAAAEPAFAGRVRKLMSTRKHLTMATLRRDGSPRISGTEVRFDAERLEIGSMPRAVKAMDLMRDPRVAIHGPTHDPAKSGRWRGEAKVAGRALPLPRDDVAHGFQIDITEVVVTSLNERGDRLVIESWTPERGYRISERE